MSTRRYRLGLIGCGAIAETGHVPAILAHRRFVLAAVCDTRADRTAAIAKLAPSVDVTNDHRTILARNDIDAVVLALHPEISVNVAIDALRAGKPVLDEKPLAINLDDARRLMRVVDETRIVYQIGFVFGYCDMVKTVGEYVKRVGSPALYRVAVYDERWNPADTEHVDRIQGILKHSSAVTHEGSHVVDFVRLWNPSPYIRASASAMKTDPSFHGPNLWSCQLTLADDSLLAMEVGWFMPDLPVSELMIAGPGGVLTMSFTGKGEFRTSGGRAERVSTAPFTQPWERQYDALAASIDAGRSLAAPISRGWDALRATEACHASARRGESVKID